MIQKTFVNKDGWEEILPNFDRLEKLYDFLGTIKEEKFDYAYWALAYKKKNVHACGTTACALGWATAIPSFKRAGLKMVYPPGRTRDLIENAMDGVEGSVEYNFNEGTSAAEEFFNLTAEDAQNLFIPGGDLGGSDISLKQYRENFREWLDNKKIETGLYEWKVVKKGR